MPDDRNFFDDDSLPPDWEQEQDSGAENLPPEDSGAPRPPWEAQAGARPPDPQENAPTPAPWELYPGEIGPAPEPSRASAPWTDVPHSAEPESLDDLRQQAGGWEAWDTSESDPSAFPASASETPADAADEDSDEDELAWMSTFGAAAGSELQVPAEDDDLAWLGEIEPGQEPPRSDAPSAPRKIDDELPWLDDETFRRIPTIEPEDEFTLSPEDAAAMQPERPQDDPFWQADDAFPLEEQPAEPAESIPDWLSQQFGESADTSEEASSPPAQPDEPGRIPGVTRRLRPQDAAPPAREESLPAEEAPSPPSAPDEPGHIRSVTSRLRPLDEALPPQEEIPPADETPSSAPAHDEPGRIPGVTRRLRPQDAVPSAPEEPLPAWLSEADEALDAVEAGQPQALTYDEWERQQEAREREERKTPEERLLESVPDWFEQLGDDPAAPAAPPVEPPTEKGAEPDFVPGWLLGLEEQNAEEAPDWFQQLDFAGDPSAAPPAPPAHVPASDEDAVPDWFKGIGAPDEAEAGEFDLFTEEPDLPRGAEATFTGWMADDEPADEGDEGDFVERFDPAGAEDVGSATGTGSVPDWLRDLESEEPPAPAPSARRPSAPAEPASADDSLDWLDELSPEDLAASESLEALFAAEADLMSDASDETPETPELADAELKQLLESYETPPRDQLAADDEAAWREEASLAAVLDHALPPDAEPDLDAFFPEIGAGQPVPGLERLFSEEAPSEPGEEPARASQAEQPEWVAELRPSDLPVTIHAGGVELDVPQTPIVELPPRVHAFREKALRELGEPAAPLPPPDVGALAGLTGALGRYDAVLPTTEPSGPLSGAIVTREHQARVKKLQALLAAAEEPEEAPAAVELLEVQAAPGQVPRRARRARQFKPDRLLIALLMLVALIAPFASDALHLADDPPPLGAAGQDTAAEMDTLAPGAYVLIAFEYGPTAAGELDPLVEAVLRDVFVQGAVPLAISTNPAGALHADAVMAPLTEDEALLAARSDAGTPAALSAGEDYVLLGYLPGDALGVRTMAEIYGEAGTIHPAFDTDLRGENTNLPIRDVAQDVALIVVVGEDTDDIRTWAEQLKGVAVPKVALVTAALEPLIDPYVYDEGYAGYLAGVRDTYSYNQTRNANARRAYTLPDDLDFDIPNPEDARWHSMALSAAAAAGLITLGMVLNLLRALVRRRP